MFGQNEIHGRKTFKDRDDLLVTSIFYTLQGEGPFAGRPAVFVRLAHCNLACSFCDTNFSHGDWLAPDIVLGKALDALPPAVTCCDAVLVITGGEPLLQDRVLVHLVTNAGLYFDNVQIESNGLLEAELPNSTYLVVSPKCHETCGKPTYYLKPNSKALNRANCLKFVITANANSPYHGVPSWAHDWQRKVRKPVYVSPMAEYKRQPDLSFLSSGDLAQRSSAERVSFWESDLLDMTRVRANHEHAARYCMQYGFRLSLQMQLFTSLA